MSGWQVLGPAPEPALDVRFHVVLVPRATGALLVDEVCLLPLADVRALVAIAEARGVRRLALRLAYRARRAWRLARARRWCS